ncbi:MAG: 2-hydroxyacyl-CoA dehydratase [Armatimonadetes bacterium]|nr:2-hydroxyacyl-CoA dehydratase [Armatimonadota bacterium]
MQLLPDLSGARYIGLTTTVPVEVILAAGFVPVDLNNVFISAPDPLALVRHAELAGFPRNVCGWIRGLYSTALLSGIRRVIAVTQGDCSQTHAMIEHWEASRVEVIPFAYPYDRDPELLRLQITRLCDRLGTTWDAAEETRKRLRPVRLALAELDRMTWRDHKITGQENHLWQVQSSDFRGDPEGFYAELKAFLDEARHRQPTPPALRLGYVGVPPIFTDLYSFLEERGARVVFNETQRQFTMADAVDADLLNQYLEYTYPYSVFRRLEDINRHIQLRRIDGLIHYVQSFCFRQIQDLLIKRSVTVPVLTLEGDVPGPLDARSRLRLEAFLEALWARRRK